MSSNPAAATFLHLLLLPAALSLPLAAAELEPAAVTAPLGEQGPRIARYSDRTLTLGIEIERDGARLLSYTLKGRPFSKELTLAEPESYRAGQPLLHLRRQNVSRTTGPGRFRRRVGLWW